MWLDSGNVFINIDHVDYICFEKTENGWAANIVFSGGESLNFEHDDIKILRNHFRKIIEVKNERRSDNRS